MSEWSIVRLSKSRVPKRDRGFESHPLRHRFAEANLRRDEVRRKVCESSPPATDLYGIFGEKEILLSIRAKEFFYNQGNFYDT